MLDSFAYYISGRNRRKKLQLFLDTMRPLVHDTILDVGVNTIEYSHHDNLLEKQYAHPQKITAVALDEVSPFVARYPDIKVVQADGRNLPFKDNQFTIGYSNAVLEHVGSSSQQLAFIKELYRVSRKGYLAIPNKYFPIEVHTRIPLAHLIFPKRWFDRLATAVGKSWAAGDYIRFLGERELRSLLSNAGIAHPRIYRQRLLGLTLTLVATWEK